MKIRSSLTGSSTESVRHKAERDDPCTFTADELTGSADAIQQHSQQIRSKDVEETMQ